MTAQILKKDTMQEIPNDPAFLMRWLNGSLSEEELSSLRNRDEYEQMVSNAKSESILSAEQVAVKKVAVLPKKEKPVEVKRNESTTFPTFVMVAFALVIAMALFFTKLEGWW